MAHKESNRKYTIFSKEYLAWREKGFSENEIFSFLQKQGYDKSKRTLHRHISTIKSTGNPLQIPYSSGRKPILDDEKCDRLETWILGKNDTNVPIARIDIQKFIFDTWSIKMTKITCGNLFKKLGFSQKTCQSKTSGY